MRLHKPWLALRWVSLLVVVLGALFGTAGDAAAFLPGLDSLLQGAGLAAPPPPAPANGPTKNYDGPSCPSGATCTNTATTTGVVQNSSTGDNVVECTFTVTTNNANKPCNADQTASGDADNIVRLNMLISQTAPQTGALNGSINLDINQLNNGTGTNRIETVVLKVLQKQDRQASSNISQSQTGSILGNITSETSSGDILVDLKPFIDERADAKASLLGAVTQTQNPNIDVDVDLTSDTGDINGTFNSTTVQKAAATSQLGNITQTQGTSGTGIDVQVDTHTDGVTTINATNTEDQRADGTSTVGTVTQNQVGPTLLGIRLFTDPNDQINATTTTIQKCNSANCTQTNTQDCEGQTEGEGNCNLNTSQNGSNKSNSQSCDVDAETGECVIKAPNGETFTCQAPCGTTVQCSGATCEESENTDTQTFNVYNNTQDGLQPTDPDIGDVSSVVTPIEGGWQVETEISVSGAVPNCALAVDFVRDTAATNGGLSATGHSGSIATVGTLNTNGSGNGSVTVSHSVSGTSPWFAHYDLEGLPCGVASNQYGAAPQPGQNAPFTSGNHPDHVT